MSSTSRRDAAKRIECPNHEGAVYMEPAIIDIRFPRGSLPVHGYRCGTCAEEVIRGGVLTAAQEVARVLGMAGVEASDTRKAMKIGSSVGATFPPDQLERLGIQPGASLRFELIGDHIEVRRETEPRSRRR